MVQPIVWENIPKSQADPTTIEEAIAATVEVHNDNAVAHMADLQAMQQHRTNPIVDHPAESVYNDKLYPNARRYVAIVDPQSEVDFDTVESAIAYAITKGGGDIFIKRGLHYINTEINIYPTISLIGEGIGETTIVLDILNSQELGVDRELPITKDSVGTVTSLATSDILTFTIAQAGSLTRFIGKSISYNDGGVTKYGRIIAMPTTLSAQIAVAATTGGGYSGGQIQQGATLTNGQSTMILHGNQTIADTSLLYGATIYKDTTSQGVKTVGVLGTQTILLDKPYTGTTHFFPMIFRYDVKERVLIEGITFEKPNSGVFIENKAQLLAGETETLPIDVLRCEFIGAGPKISNFGNTSTIRDCLVDCGTEAAISIDKAVIIENCTFKAIIAGARAVLGGYGNRVLFCGFKANGFSNHLWLGDTYGAAVIIGNHFQSVGDMTLRNYPDDSDYYNCIYTGNVFIMSAAKTLTIDGYGFFFVQNDIQATANKLILTSFTNGLVVMGNKVGGGITNNGADNLIQFNYPENNAFTTTTTATAIDMLKNILVVQSPSATKTLTTTVPPAGEYRYLNLIQTSITAKTITFGTGFKSTGTLALGTVANRQFTLCFVSNGTSMLEVSRTIAYIT